MTAVSKSFVGLTKVRMGIQASRGHRGRGMDTKLYLIILLTSFGLMILGAVAGGILESAGIVTGDSLGPRATTVINSVYLVLFFIMGFSLVPLVLRLFITLQIKIGNGEFFPIKWLQANELAVVIGVWGLYVIGIGIILTLVKPADLFK